VIDGTLDIPKPPTGLDKPTREFWDSFWRSDLALATHAETDLPAFRRLATLYTELGKLTRGVSKNPYIEGSRGQVVANPMWSIRSGLLSEVRQLEDRFGCNPRARLNLGLQLGQVRRTLEDLSSLAREADRPDPRIIDDPLDPRITDDPA
jgi:P27 family predicted phage terminase small subunit